MMLYLKQQAQSPWFLIVLCNNNKGFPFNYFLTTPVKWVAVAESGAFKHTMIVTHEGKRIQETASMGVKRCFERDCVYKYGTVTQSSFLSSSPLSIPSGHGICPWFLLQTQPHKPVQAEPCYQAAFPFNQQAGGMRTGSGLGQETSTRSCHACLPALCLLVNIFSE